ncbi:MAG: hypothetical protein JO345_15255 [Streptosporangiaceae bacterium]|nr:hypothetical protein [Streptosporangiaceae bacterium]
MKPARAASRRSLPGSPFNAPPVDPPPVEQFAAGDQVSHDKYGLGRVTLVEDDAVVVDFGSRKVRILSPFAKLSKL